MIDSACLFDLLPLLSPAVSAPVLEFLVHYFLLWCGDGTRFAITAWSTHCFQSHILLVSQFSVHTVRGSFDVGSCEFDTSCDWVELAAS